MRNAVRGLVLLGLAACGGAVRHETTAATPTVEPDASVAPAPSSSEVAAAPDPEDADSGDAGLSASDDAPPVEPPSVAPSVARAELVPGDARVVAPLHEHARVHLGNVLRTAHHARTTLVDALFLVAPDGTSRVYALYAFSLWEACVVEHGGGPDARHACIDTLDEELDVPTGQAGRTCEGHGLARMDFPAPAAGASDPAGHTDFVDLDLPRACRLETTHELALRDVDLDGRTELVVDVTLARPDYHYRGSSERTTDTEERWWLVLREDDMQEQGRVLRYRYDDDDDPTWSGSSASRLALRDTDGDGRADLVVDTIRFPGHDAPCPVDATGDWTPPCPAGEPEHEVRRFSRAHDVWAEAAE